ncbi:MAG: anti-sigma B factor RsbW [candidate division WS1 bacterium]|jgi:serine/threonine-protein kinase RsbW|nr:anti-sigma B factor RsbW [candidate division WS1 bacterium]
MAGKGEHVIEVTLPSRPEYLLVARLATSGVGLRAGLTVDDIEDLKVAVAEACTNVINHAFKKDGGSGGQRIQLRLTAGKGELTVEVEDEGQGFDPEDLKKSQRSGLEGEGGLGFGLMKELTDTFRVESAPGSGTRVIMVKRATR